jgi:hypothetical protein
MMMVGRKWQVTQFSFKNLMDPLIKSSPTVMFQNQLLPLALYQWTYSGQIHLESSGALKLSRKYLQ